MKEPLEVFSDYLSRKNLKMTPQRRLILDIFLREKGHLASEDLYTIVKRFDKSIGQATVYRTLKLLSESGLAKEVKFGDGVTRYEQKYGNSHHDHIICEECGKALSVVDEKIEELQERLAEEHGFVLTGHEMYLYGLCADCRRKKGGH
ncbi:Fur family ferric uptake transcriptional regulator [Desulfobaculum xiamenense]|uniref:Ferric uptake regulation protein n=1 Tax=Desulfobaculum xiamenense TaxID=995050 RepID=A0A846QK13_9BACT|nr:Fur family transcriptional regulator [Desulfobaculum xiamenense]NJB68481.1 Fur family ferric uptake transcriptional regulator [Desulfobaculum xiamenense]